MKKILLCFVGIMAILSFGFKGLAFAEEIDCSGVAENSAFCRNQNKSDENPLIGENSVGRRVIQLLTLFAGVVSIIVMIIGGINFITSNGNPQKVTTAKNTILYASIGIVISLIAQFIVIFVLSNA